MGEEPRSIRLDQFLKWQGMVGTGGQAKLMIQGGEVQVNGQVETHRSRKLVPGDRVTVEGETVEVTPLPGPHLE
jgi:ribosome-associated protein